MSFVNLVSFHMVLALSGGGITVRQLLRVRCCQLALPRVGSSSLEVKPGVGKSMSDKAIFAKVNHAIDVFNAFYGKPIVET